MQDIPDGIIIKYLIPNFSDCIKNWTLKSLFNFSRTCNNYKGMCSLTLGKLKEIYFDSLNLVKKHNFDFFENINLNFSDIPGANDARGNNFSWNIIILAKWLRNNKYN